MSEIVRDPARGRAIGESARRAGSADGRRVAMACGDQPNVTISSGRLEPLSRLLKTCVTRSPLVSAASLITKPLFVPEY